MVTDNKKGLLFEYLVELILKRMYPDIQFEHTKYVHDGGKDFYSTSDDEKIWVEAKCHREHLGLGRIAGSFIMADICQINQIIVFSYSKLTEGAIANLAKYATFHGKIICFFYDTDLWELIRDNAAFSDEEIAYEMNRNSEICKDKQKPISARYERELGNKPINNIVKNIGEDEFLNGLLSVDYSNGDSENEIVEFQLRLLAIYLYNLIHDKYPQTAERQVICEHHIITNLAGANCQETNYNVAAFQIFSSELVFRNEFLHDCKKIQVNYPTSTHQYKNLTSPTLTFDLLPGQCVAIIHHFRALNDSTRISVPDPMITIDDCPAHLCGKMIRPELTCRVVGETPFLPPNNIYLTNCLNYLNATIQFSTIVAYGKSGIGKTRFLHEFQSEMIKQNRRCFFFHGESICNSASDFLRQLLFGYYNLDFDYHSERVEFPQSLDGGIAEELAYISDFLTGNQYDQIKTRNWLTSFLRKRHLSFIIDNVQTLGAEILALLSGVISDLRCSQSKSVILLSFNTDLMLPGSIAYNFFTNQKKMAAKECCFELQEFDNTNAVRYLTESLDPFFLRNDTEELCERIVRRVGKNPLFLKQIVLYLNQIGVIGFRNETICILNHSGLIAAIDDLPETIHEMVEIRYRHLIKGVRTKQRRIVIRDIFWSILLFGNLPLRIASAIDNYNATLLSKCFTLGFVKFNENNDLIFEHQLIEKSLLLILEGNAYTAHPEITDIGISCNTAVKLLGETSYNNFPIVHFVLQQKFGSIDYNDVKTLIEKFSFESVTDLLIPYAVRQIEKQIEAYNDQLVALDKIRSIDSMITRCQDRLGVSKAKDLFKSILQFQMDNYIMNQPCPDKFLDLMKYYMYELPSGEKETYLEKMQEIATSLFQNRDVFSQQDNSIWFLWAKGKMQIEMHDFVKAEMFLYQGVEEALRSANSHRLAELEVQLAHLNCYLENPKEAITHWSTASENFQSDGIYDSVLHFISMGNAKLLNNKYTDLDDICSRLSEKYLFRDCYDFLKTVIDEFLCTYKIISFVENDSYDKEMIDDTDHFLSRYRMDTLTYSAKKYFHAIYKTLLFNKYIIERFADYDNSNRLMLCVLLSEELISSFDWEKSDLHYFLPVIKDIAEIAAQNQEIYNKLSALLPVRYQKTFYDLSCKRANALGSIPQGIFTDRKKRIRLMHYSFSW